MSNSDARRASSTSDQLSNERGGRPITDSVDTKASNSIRLEFGRFSLADLLRWTALCGCIFALVSWLGPYGWLIAPLVLIGYSVARKDSQLFVDGLLFLGSIAVLVMLLTPLDSGVRIPNRRGVCSSQLHQITLALHVYHEKHGSYPPAYFANEQGRPTHSWRAMILSELGRADLAARYRWDEPWDGPNNRKLHREAIKLLRCPSDTSNSETATSYVVVVGPGTMFPGAQSVRQSQITDPYGDTLLLIEVRNGGFEWFEPRDLHVSQMAPTINGNRGQGPSSGHNAGANAAFADLRVRFLPNDLPPETLRGLLTISGGEAVAPR